VAELSVYTEATDSWFFLSFPATLTSAVAGPEETKNLAGKCPPPDSDPFNDAEFGKNSPTRQDNLPQARITDSFTPHSNDKVIETYEQAGDFKEW
jgi:hypothetical protein